MFLESKGKSKAGLIAGILIVSALWGTQAAAQFYKCVDASGKVTFSDQGCRASEDGSALNIQPANSMDGARHQQPAYAQPNGIQDASRDRARVTVVGGNSDAERQRKKLCKEASTPLRGAHGLTASQRAAAAQLCAGVSVPVPDYGTGSHSMPAPAPPPAGIASCDPGGCWDTNGLRYNQGAGSTFIPANGGHACQLINGSLICP